MAGIRFPSYVRCLHSSIKGSLNKEVVQQYLYHQNGALSLARTARLPIDFLSHPYFNGESHSPRMFAQNQFSSLVSPSIDRGHHFSTTTDASFHSRLSGFCPRSTIPFASMTHMLNSRMYSSSLGGKGSQGGDTEVSAGSGVSDMNGGGDSVVSGDWALRMNDTWKSVVEAASYAGQKVKEASDELTPYAQKLLDSHPYLDKVVIPVGSTLTATLIAWFLLPKVLRKFHKYAIQGPTSLFPGSMFGEPVPYEKSFWAAMEDPVRYLVTFIAFSQMLVSYLQV